MTEMVGDEMVFVDGALYESGTGGAILSRPKHAEV